ncbi:hypothetical protein [Halosimplex halobium]|uniref:hypothetical protein n=1 Tax=Halosimplex halobium TaxID=3396618 RepID=UPI003F544B08
MAGRKPDASDDEIIAVLEEASDPVLSTREVANELPIKQNAAQKRLKRLHDKGRIAGKKAGQGWVWWAVDHESEEQ